MRKRGASASSCTGAGPSVIAPPPRGPGARAAPRRSGAERHCPGGPATPRGMRRARAASASNPCAAAGAVGDSNTARPGSPPPSPHRRSRYRSQHASTMVSAAARSRPSASPTRRMASAPPVRLSARADSAAAYASLRPSGRSARAPSTGRGEKRRIWQRDSTVAGSARSCERMRTITVWAGGSSSVLRIACGAGPVMRSASSTMNTFHADSAGRSAASRSSSRMSSMRSAGGPFGFFSGGVGAITRTSGHAPRSMRPARPGSPGATSAFAKASAAALRPDPAGPTNAYAWAIRPAASARLRTSTASS